MQCSEARLEVLQARPRRLDDERPFRFALDGILPAIRRRNRRLHVDARRQTLVHECSRERVGALIVGHRRQNNDEVIHFFTLPRLYFVTSWCTVFRACRRPTPQPPANARRRRPSAPCAAAVWCPCCCSSSPARSSSTASSAKRASSRGSAPATSTRTCRRPSSASGPTTHACARKPAASRTTPAPSKKSPAASSA